MPVIADGGGIRVMVVAHRLILSMLQRIVDEQRPRLTAVVGASKYDAAIEAASRTKPDVVLLDVDLLEDAGPDLLPKLINDHHARVVLLGEEPDAHEAAILSGAVGVVRKDDAPEVLIKAIQKVHEGQLWLDRSTTGRLFARLSTRASRASEDPAQRRIATLTEREQDVVRVLTSAPGADNKKLATDLHICEHTLRNHLSHIYDKLGVTGRLELYVFAERHGLKGSATKVQ